jgi:glutamine synthetase
MASADTFAQPQEAREFLAAHPDIESFELYLIDANGVPRGKLLRRDEVMAVYEQGRPLPSSILGLTIHGEDADATGLVWDVGDADCLTFPLPGSLTLQPWRAQPTAQFQVAMHPQLGQPAAMADPRGVLARVVAQLAADGLHPVMAGELEFYLLDRERDAQGRPQPARQRDGERPREPQAYGLREIEQFDDFFDRLYGHCKVQKLPARAAISEYAPGQLELTLHHRDALGAMDELIRYRRTVKGTAQQCGMQACFMAKPFADLAGSGMHLHVSLTDAGGANLFASDDPAGTPLLRHAIGGLLQTMGDAVALFCPGANAYRRFQANSYAPMAPTWGINNRTVSVRIPTGTAASRHLEHRVCGADANPYLAAAAVLAAMHRGIREQLDPGAPVSGNDYRQPREPIVSEWGRALERLRQAPWLHDALGPDFVRIFLAIKESEYRRFMSEVGEQDWRWYLHSI